MSQQLLYDSFVQIVDSILPLDISPDQRTIILEQFLSYIDQTTNAGINYDLHLVVSQLKRLFTSDAQWNLFQQAVKILLRYKEDNDVARYLSFFNSINIENIDETRGQRRHFILASHTRSMTTTNNGLIRNNASQSSSLNNINEFGVNNKRQRSNFTGRAYDSQSINDLVNDILLEFQPDHIKESEMIQFIFYTLLSSTSDLFPVDKVSGKIAIPESIGNSTSGILHLIFEASVLFKYLMTATKKNHYKSQIKVAFLSNVLVYLQQYTQLINELSVSNANDMGKTLTDVYRHLVGEIDKFRFLYFLTDKLEKIPGNEFLSLVFGYSNFGDLLIKEVAMTLFKVSSEPYYKVLENWIINGELSDSDEEFFIYNDLEEKSNGISAIKFDDEKYPKFLSAKIKHKIYQIGKMIKFLRDVCKEYNFLNGYNQKFRSFLSKRELRSFNENQFSILIDSQFKELSNYSTYLLYNTYHLDYHILNLKKFLLLSKGDFIYTLIENSLAVLGEPSQSLSVVQLSQILSNSIENSSIKSSPRDMLLRLDARILSLNSSANLGWDVFTLDYKLDEALRVIIYDNNMGLRNYLKLFNFLWRIKRISFMLDQSWHGSNIIYKRNIKDLKHQPQNFWVVKLFNKVNIIKNGLIKFITKLLGYLSFDMIDVAFEELLEKLNKSKNLYLTNSVRESSIKNNKLDSYLVKFRQVLLPNKEYVNAYNDSIVDDGTPMPDTFEVDHEIYSIDEFINLHCQYLEKIGSHKLIDSSLKRSVGLFSGKFFVHQINGLVGIVSKFLQAEEEFHNLILEIVSQLKLGDNHDDGDDTMESLYGHNSISKMKKVVKYISREINGEFIEKKRVFVKDLINDRELQNFGLDLGT